MALPLLDPAPSSNPARRQFWSLVGVEPPPEPRPSLALARQPVLEEIASDAIRRGRVVAGAYQGQKQHASEMAEQSKLMTAKGIHSLIMALAGKYSIVHRWACRKTAPLFAASA